MESDTVTPIVKKVEALRDGSSSLGIYCRHPSAHGGA
jgi:hypothetical protein